MGPSLFHEIIYGPVKSRRLGNSLGINIIPTNEKICSFDCLYCECGWTQEFTSNNFIDSETFKNILEDHLKKLNDKNINLDSITFSGNGESTLHPEFLTIVRQTISLRDKYFFDAKVTVLTNGSMLHLPQVQEALSIIDQPILKLDSAIQQEFEIINRPMYKINIQTIIENYANLSVSNKIIQTLLLRGKYNETKIDNTSEESLNALVSAINKINPKIWMLYVIDRPTPANNLEKLTFAELEEIKTKLQDKVNCEIKIYA